MQLFKIVSITDKTGNQRTDGRYPKRIGRICERPIARVGEPMIINYLKNTDGSDYSGFYLRCSIVVKIEEDFNYLCVETINSIYKFEKMEG